jgi:hypothetical protein
MSGSLTASTSTQFDLKTEQFAARNGVRGPSVRERFCRVGHYFGVRPLKLTNGRLLWPDVRVEIPVDMTAVEKAHIEQKRAKLQQGGAK